VWVKLDDGFVSHPKIVDLSDRAFRLHVAALCHSGRNLTDGWLSPRAVRTVAVEVDADPVELPLELVAAGVWERDDAGGYRIHDFGDYNPTAERVKADREKARKRMAAARSSERSPKQVREREGGRAVARSPSPSRPDPDTRDSEAAATTPASTAGQELEKALDRIGIEGPLRMAALSIDSERALACALKAEKVGKNPGAYLRRLLESGDWPTPVSAARATLAPFDRVAVQIANGALFDQHDLDAEIRGYKIKGPQADELRGLLNSRLAA
jgi:hypothetical protein